MSPAPASLTSARLAQAFSNIGHFYTHVLMLLYGTVVLALGSEFDMTYGERANLAILSFVLFGVGALPAGWLSDKWSQVGMMAVFFFGTGAACIATGFATSPWQIVVGLAAMGLFASIYHPVGMAWLIRNTDRPGKALGFNAVFGSLGIASAALIAGWLTDLISWRAAFITPGIVVMLTGAIMLLCVGRGWVLPSTADLRPPQKVSRKAIVRVFVILTITMAAAGFIFQVLSFAAPKIFEERVAELTGGSIAATGNLVFAVFLVPIVAHLMGGYLADRASGKVLYVVSYVVMAPLLLVGAWSYGTPLIALMAGTLLFHSVASLVENVLLAKYSPGRWRATLFGAKFVLALGISAAAIPIIGAIFDATGDFFWIYMMMAGLAGIVAVSAVFLPKDTPGRMAAPGAAPDAVERAPPAIVPAQPAE